MRRLAPRKVPQQERSRELVRAIVEGAARVFEREGLSATTNRIAEEAGVSVGSLYQYFPNKESLLIALAERHLDRTADVLRPVLATAAARSLEDFVRALLCALVAEHGTHPSMQQLIRQFAHRSPPVMDRLAVVLAEIEDALVAHLDGEVSRPRRRARLAIAALDGALHRTLPDELLDDDYIDDLSRLCVVFLTG